MQIPREIFHSFVAAVDGGNIKTMPNRSMPAAPYPTPGALLMGDAFNMRHPLTGGGMTVALSDIVILRNLLRHLSNLNDAPALCNYLESFYTLRKVTCKISCKSTVSSVFLASSFPWLCCLHMESYSPTNLLGSLDLLKYIQITFFNFPSLMIEVYITLVNSVPLMFGIAASGIHHQYIGRCLVPGIFCISWWSKEGNAPGLLWLSKSWRYLLVRTSLSALRLKSPSINLGSPFLCCCNIWCWSNFTAISFTLSLLDWS